MDNIPIVFSGFPRDRSLQISDAIKVKFEVNLFNQKVLNKST